MRRRTTTFELVTHCQTVIDPKKSENDQMENRARTEGTGGAALAGGIGRVWSVRGGRDDGGAVGGEEEARGRGAGESEDLGAGER